MNNWGILNYALLGAVIGGLYGLIAQLMNRSRQKNPAVNTVNMDAAPPKWKMKTSDVIIIVVIVAAVTFALSFIGNLAQGDPKEKAFSKEGMTITLTDNFHEKDYLAYTAFYESQTSFVFVIKEDFSLFEEAGIPTDISLYEYSDIIAKSNNTDLVIKEKDGLVYYEYDYKAENGKEISYFVVLYRGEDAYWIFNFACESKNYEKLSGDFLKWAKSVTV